MTELTYNRTKFAINFENLVPYSQFILSYLHKYMSRTKAVTFIINCHKLLQTKIYFDINHNMKAS